ncbi:MAG: hypothetical protein FJX68_08375 [Alphaproteobacteria bacterium]|nr:hypothetical protein [Alphaproteobacteria bacterium]
MTTGALRDLAKSLLPNWLWRKAADWQRERDLPAVAKVERAADATGAFAQDPGIAPTVAAALAWLDRAQDRSASADGGVARHFSLLTGWADSYPETTGYIIPTLLECGAEAGQDELVERARRMLDWCLEIQMPDGGFQGGTVNARSKVAVTFNTGQILLGLAADAARWPKPAYRDAMHHAAIWLRDSLDADGAWRKHPTPFAKPGEKTYETHVAWGLFEAERAAPGNGYGEAGLRQVRWALGKQAENGWFADCCLEDRAHPLTHTLGYALRGVVEAYRLTGEASLLVAAEKTARGLLTALADDGRLPGRLDAGWRAAVPWVCLTGSVQIAHSWLLLHEATGDPAYRDAARRANAYVRRRVRLAGSPDQVGGIKGSFPVDGDYGRFEYLNWAAKFFIDANRAEARMAG